MSYYCHGCYAIQGICPDCVAKILKEQEESEAKLEECRQTIARCRGERGVDEAWERFKP